MKGEEMRNEELIKEKKLECILDVEAFDIVKEKLYLLLEVLDGTYLTEDNYANDIYLRDDVVKAIEEILNGDYKKHVACYNCKRKNDCKYKSSCKYSSPLVCETGDYFERNE